MFNTSYYMYSVPLGLSTNMSAFLMKPFVDVESYGLYITTAAACGDAPNMVASWQHVECNMQHVNKKRHILYIRNETYNCGTRSS